MVIDLNADLGEGAGTDIELMQLVTSANVSCGAHAGTLADIQSALRAAVRHGVSVGAHPGHADPEHFGRRELPITPDQVRQLLLRQVDALRTIASTLGLSLRYIKPHGGLYHQVCREPEYAEAAVLACEELRLPILALPGSRIEEAARGRIPFFPEGFADRGYRPDGSLIPRGEPGALLTSFHEAASQAIRLAGTQGIRSLCVHGDTPDAIRFVSAVRQELQAAGIELRAFA